MLSLQCVSPLVVPSKGKRSHSSTRLETKPSEGPCVRTHGGQANPRQACAVGENASPPRSCRPPAPSRPGRQRWGQARAPSPWAERTCRFRPRRTRRGGGRGGGRKGKASRRSAARGAAGRPAGAPHLPPDWPRRRRPAGGGRMMDGLSAGPGPSSGGLASVNTSALRGSGPWAERARGRHKRTRLGMFRF